MDSLRRRSQRVIIALLCAPFAAPAAAQSPGAEASMIRVLACESADAKMELYLPQALVFPAGVARGRPPFPGYYALDVTAANKGKVLEPVRVGFTPDGRTVIVDQYVRKLPPVRIPVEGGTVDFDQRFGKRAKCGRFGVRTGAAER
jgi:hypothetical protein